MSASRPAATAGIGARPSATATDILALIRCAEALSGHRVARLAVPEFRRGLPALEEVAADLGVGIELIGQDALLATQHRCPTRSEAALRATGLASVAEGCALAAGGVLILPRIDGPGVTCALSSGAGA